MTDRIRVAVAGAKGRMGREVVGAVGDATDLVLVAQVGAGDDLGGALTRNNAQVVVDFTVPEAVMGNIEAALSLGVVPIVGTTGLGQDDVAHVRSLCRRYAVGALVAPNFALGAVLMMRFCRDAAHYLPDAEIIEMHHERKLDSPSGTAAKTAEMIAEGRGGAAPMALPSDAVEKIVGSRGGKGLGTCPSIACDCRDWWRPRWSYSAASGRR